MRVLIVLLTSLLVAQVANAQTTASETTDVQLLKFSWSKERLNWERNPFGGPNENFHQMQFRARSEKRVTDAKRAGQSADIARLERDAKTDAAIVAAANQSGPPPRYYFFYKASVKNVSTKAIKEIDWDYVFTDAATGTELDRRQFTSVQNIGPGKQKELVFQLPTPPTRRISIHALDKKERVGIDERVVIVRVKYADGSEWQMQ
ncbi:MAG TPA: hypothetical protein VJ656_05900 [Pyrinomonadaceae bacterium]|nr:hypothetical protein [Pyrinomonadaceae bacterium]